MAFLMSKMENVFKYTNLIISQITPKMSLNLKSTFCLRLRFLIKFKNINFLFNFYNLAQKILKEILQDWYNLVFLKLIDSI